MPLPRHTPVASSCSCLLGSHPASWRASEAAAMAYCVNVEVLRCSVAVNQSLACHRPSRPSPLGTTPATVLGRSRHCRCGSECATLTIPVSPARRRDQVRRTPTPKGVTAPRPVTTTRRITLPWPSQSLVDYRERESSGTGRIVEHKLRRIRQSGLNGSACACRTMDISGSPEADSQKQVPHKLLSAVQKKFVAEDATRATLHQD